MFKFISVGVLIVPLVYVWKLLIIEFIHFRSSDPRKRLISTPSNFNHVTHYGPEEGIKAQAGWDITKHTSFKQDSNGGNVDKQNEKTRQGVKREKSFASKLSFKLPKGGN